MIVLIKQKKESERKTDRQRERERSAKNTVVLLITRYTLILINAKTTAIYQCKDVLCSIVYYTVKWNFDFLKNLML
jgi:hypothetical protein